MVYVDDLLVTETSNKAVEQFSTSMLSLEIKYIGVVNKFLGLRILFDDKCGYMLDQEVMIDGLLKGHVLESANGVRSPIDEDCNEADPDYTDVLVTSDGFGHASVKAFQSLVGSLLWIARCTRPDISFAVHRATRQTYHVSMKDWKMAKLIARYL